MIPLFKVAMSTTAHSAVAEVLASGMVGEGPQVARFQKALSKLFEHGCVIPLSSCTASLALALRMAGVGPGDEVISSPFTMVATSAMIKQAGGTIRWCDIEPATLCADTRSIREMARAGATKAIVITCVGGLVPQGLEQLAELDIPVILDCAHALTTTYRDKHISHWGDYCCFSFQSIKPLTTGDGGALTLRDSAALERAERLKWYGMSRRVPESVSRLQHQMAADIAEWGYKYHLNDIAAAIGLSNIDLALENIQTTGTVSRGYLKALKGLDAINPVTPAPQCSPDWWLFGMLASERDHLIDHLAENGIESSPMWARNDRYTAFQEPNSRPLPNLDRVVSEVIFVPNGWWLSDDDQQRIVSALKDFY